MLVILYREYRPDKEKERKKKKSQDNHREKLKKPLKAYHIYKMLVSFFQLFSCCDLFTLFQGRHGRYFLKNPHSFLKKAEALL